jgi:hypothetical protein
MLISKWLMPALENDPKKVISKITLKNMQKRKFGRAVVGDKCSLSLWHCLRT